MRKYLDTVMEEVVNLVNLKKQIILTKKNIFLGWTIHKLLYIDLLVNKYKPIRGGGRFKGDMGRYLQPKKCIR